MSGSPGDSTDGTGDDYQGSRHDAHDHDGLGHDHGGLGHSHGGSDRSSRTLAVIAVINLAGFVVELAGGLLFGSVALLSDAVHMLFDALAYVMAFLAAYVAHNYDHSDRFSYGLHRLEPLSAFLNGALLFPMVAFILWESYQRFLAPIDIGTGPTLAIATFGLAVNAISVYYLEGREMTLNERGAFYHLLGDAGGSVAVIVSTLVVQVTGVRVVDPITAALIAVLVAWSAVKLLSGSGAIFLGRSPVDPARLRSRIESIEGVSTVLDFHAWQICSEITVATAHVTTTADTMADADAVTYRVHDLLADEGVTHATVELSDADADRSRRLDAHGH